MAADIREIFAAADVLSQLRTVQAIVTHLEPFPPERARATPAPWQNWSAPNSRDCA